jgi:capsular polysaccharide biosynthesis protein
MRLLPRPQSELRRHETIESLLSSPDDGIFYLRNTAKKAGQLYLQDVNPSPYVIKLVNPLLVPMHAIRLNLQSVSIAANWSLRRKLPWLPRGLSFGKADLLVTADRHVVADSFSRSAIVHPSMVLNEDGSWDVPMSGSEKFLEGRHHFLETIPGHFGHMLVDMPARLWTAREARLAALANLPLVAFATHGLSRETGIPPMAKGLLAAMGGAIDRITLANQPLRVQELIIPGRISPHLGPGGPKYNALLQEAGRKIASSKIGGVPFVYLSRSQLGNDRRPMDLRQARHIDDLFLNHGFDVVHPQELDLSEQIAAIRGATHIAGFIGSQLHLSAFSERKGLQMFRICPDDFVTMTDNKILSPLEGTITDFKISRPRSLVRNFRPQKMRPDDADLDRLNAAIRSFIKSDDKAYPHHSGRGKPSPAT